MITAVVHGVSLFEGAKRMICEAFVGAGAALEGDDVCVFFPDGAADQTHCVILLYVPLGYSAQMLQAVRGSLARHVNEWAGEDFCSVQIIETH